jgi:predicted TIM-barrel fold metal-dependent hydrolase
VDRIADFLRRYPNASVDVAARLVHLELQASTHREKVRQFFIDFQDRILYGTDLARGPDQTDEALAEEAHQAWLADWKFLAGDSQLRSTDFAGALQGLALPRKVLDKVYHANARRLFPGAWQKPH